LHLILICIKKKIHVYHANPDKKEIQLDFPKPSLLPDPLLGDQWVYKQNLMLHFKAPTLKSNSSTLSIQYQGCATGGFCYPPQTVSYHLEKKNNIFNLSALSPNTPHTQNNAGSLHDSAIQALEQANLATQLALFYLIGLLLAFTPCVLPMLPILASVIITEEKLSTFKGFFLSLSYVLSMATTYALAGILAVKMGQSIQLFFQNIWVVGLFSLFFLYLGLVQLEKITA
jgi:thiol:disulfide interchange protein DsbD